MEYQHSQPNIILITVDELRYPMHFPEGIETPAAFFEKFMPNVYNYLWADGVKFSNYHSAACVCSPARGVMATGLYSHQTGMLTVRRIDKDGHNLDPELAPVFPTYGKLLRMSNYTTAYIGKWHLSNEPERDSANAGEYLNNYGFDSYSIPDPTGLPGQGIGEMNKHAKQRTVNLNNTQLNDSQIGAQAVAWLKAYAYNSSANDSSGPKKPFCLTVSFINPHDKQYFWGGTEWKTFKEAYKKLTSQEPGRAFNPTPKLSKLKSHGYPAVPPNWQSEEELYDKPSLQRAYKQSMAYLTGGISETPTGYFKAVKTGLKKGSLELEKIDAPFSYWQRALDMYTQVMTDVDVQIGTVLSQIPEKFKQNTVIVFTSDHGDQASSHGMQNKGWMVYRESYNVPLIIKELYAEKRITDQPGIIRDHLASSVDLAPMLVSIANGAELNWYDKEPFLEFKPLYASRFDLLKIVKNPAAPGRRFAALTSDEIFPNHLNPIIKYGMGKGRRAPIHVIGCIFDNFEYIHEDKSYRFNGKFGFYCDWKQVAENGPQIEIDPDSIQLEYYNYSDQDSQLEKTSDLSNPELLEAMKSYVLNELLPCELQKQLPAELEEAKHDAFGQYWKETNRENGEGEHVVAAYLKVSHLLG